MKDKRSSNAGFKPIHRSSWKRSPMTTSSSTTTNVASDNPAVGESTSAYSRRKPSTSAAISGGKATADVDDADAGWSLLEMLETTSSSTTTTTRDASPSSSLKEDRDDDKEDESENSNCGELSSDRIKLPLSK